MNRRCRREAIFGFHLPSRLALIAAGIMLSMSASLAEGTKPALLREKKVVVVDGVRETWLLRWDRQPTAVCGAEEGDVSLTCPCSGFAYGQQGELSLVRLRPAAKLEKLQLGQFFIRDELPGDGPAVLQRWPPDLDRDISAGENDAEFIHAVVKRGLTDLMKFGDYDHDGHATEFLLQVGTLPCGKHQMLLVGISKQDPHLHAFSAVEKPDAPLVLGAWQWEALLRSRGTVRTINWPCGDHGSEIEWTDAISAENGVLHDVRTSRKCSQSEQEGAPFDATPPH